MADVIRPEQWGAAVEAQEPDAYVIATLRRILRRAKRGEVRAVAVGYVATGGYPVTSITCPENHTVHNLLTAAIRLLDFRQMEMTNGSPTADPDLPEDEDDGA